MFENIYTRLYYDPFFLNNFKFKFKKDNFNNKQIKEYKNKTKIPKYSIQMLGNSENSTILSLFDSTGKGFGDMEDWYLCNGQNGAPDLRKRFLVGKDGNFPEYSSIGKTGDLDKVKLTINEMPSHTHIDSSHRHYNSFQTDSAGFHSHSFSDYSPTPFFLGASFSTSYQDHTNTLLTKYQTQAVSENMKTVRLIMLFNISFLWHKVYLFNYLLFYF